MSKISVFKFKINDKDLANKIVTDFIKSEDYEYSTKEQFFIGESFGNFEKCLKIEIADDELIIKAFTRNTLTNLKAYIHIPINTSYFGKVFYKELQDNLFSELQNNNINLISIEKEKVKDDGNKNLIKGVLLLVVPFIIIWTILVLIIYFSTH